MILVTILIFLAILIIGHELGHFWAARRFGVRVDEFGFGLPPRIASRKRGETRFSLNLLPLGGFVRIHGQQREEDKPLEEPERAFTNQPIYRRAIILIAGVAANFIIGWLALSLVFSIGISPKIFITQVLPGSAAEAAGFKANEELAGFKSGEEFINFIKSHQGETITVNDKKVAVPQEGIIGVGINTFSIPQENPIQSLVKGFDAALGITAGIIKAVAGLIGNIFTGEGDGLKQVAGPVGIFNLIKETEGAALLIYLLGLLSINLAIFNLLPIPALDGGHLLFLGIEKAIGRPVPRRVEIIANAIGFALLLLLIIKVTFQDIARF